MSQGHYQREVMATAHRRELEREAEQARLAAEIARPRGSPRAALVALALIVALVASGLLGFGYVEMAQHHTGLAPHVALMRPH
jgi:hypothetical protein